MKNLALVLLAAVFLMGCTQQAQPTPAPTPIATPAVVSVTVSTDARDYAQGDSIKVTATNNGAQGVAYTECQETFFQASDSSGTQLSITNPLVGKPCATKSLAPGQSISYSWNQGYFDAKGDAVKLQPGAYTILFAGATTAFSVHAAAATPVPSPTYKLSGIREFEAECSGSYELRGFIKKDDVREGNINEAGNLTKMWIAYDGAGAFAPLAGYPPAIKPATIDASSSIEYAYFGTAEAHPTFEFPCWLRIEKMTEKAG